MNDEEFQAKLETLSGHPCNTPYVSFDAADEVCLDGHFTLEQLELVVAQMKSLVFP